MSDSDRKAEIGGTVIGVAVEKTQSAKSGNPCAEMENEASPRTNGASSVLKKVDSGTTEPDVVYHVGDQVEGNFRGSDKWKPGRIYKVNSDGTIHISYDDASHEEYVPAKLVRKLKTSAVSSPAKLPTLTIGTNVHANFRGKGLWYRGTISRVHKDGTFNIDYYDGEEEAFVAPDNVKALTDPVKARCHYNLKEGCIVSAKYLDTGTWQTARVSFVYVDGSSDLTYHDGTIEYRKSVSAIELRPVIISHNWNSGESFVEYPDGRCEHKVRLTRMPWESEDWLIAVTTVLFLAVFVLIIVERAEFSALMDEI